jgi:hypothetical protein
MASSGGSICFQCPKWQIRRRPFCPEKVEADPVGPDLSGSDCARLESNRVKRLAQSIADRALTEAEGEDLSIRHQRDISTLLKGRAVGDPVAALLSSGSDKGLSRIGMTGRLMLRQVPYSVAI